MKKLLLPIIAFITITTSVCQGQNPILWGMTNNITINKVTNKGVLFKIVDSTETDLHAFGKGTDGVVGLSCSLLKASNGLIYGVTSGGGVNDSGTIFSYNISTGVETDIFDFTGTNGSSPSGSLIQASNGLLYGMTYGGGTYHEGIIFSYDITSNTETNLYDFGNGTDGKYPHGSLIQASDTLLYGCTYDGGTIGYGTLFSYDITTGTETDIHDFNSGSNDGQNPNGSLIQASDGLLYGMTYNSYSYGNYYQGTIFSYDISTGVETDLHNFNAYSGGVYPEGALLQASNGMLYGMTTADSIYGGILGYGKIFSYNTTTGNYAVVHNFNGLDGFQTLGTLIQASNGLLYGMTELGGSNGGYGTIFSFNDTTNTETVVHSFADTGGWLPMGNLIEDDDATTTGVNSVNNKNFNTMVYPNPNNGDFFIDLHNITGKSEIETYNVLGEKIYRADLNSDRTEINLTNFTDGIYFYRILNENGNSISEGKIIIQR